MNSHKQITNSSEEAISSSEDTNPQEIKVIVISGDVRKRDEFTHQMYMAEKFKHIETKKIFDSECNLFYFNVFKFENKIIWITSDAPESYLTSTHFTIDLVIYMDVNTNRMLECEKLRNKKTSVATNFPKLEDYFFSNFNLFKEAQDRIIENVYGKPILILCAKALDENSLFYFLPKELLEEIIKVVNNIEGKLDYYKQSIFYSPPPLLTSSEENSIEVHHSADEEAPSEEEQTPPRKRKSRCNIQ